MVHTASTGALSPGLLKEIRALLEAAFGERFSPDDWEHATGGIHAWMSGPSGVVSHASIVERMLECSGQSLAVGYVEAVATVAEHRRKGYASSVMRRVGGLIRERYALGALSTGSHSFYESMGWERWQGPTFADGPHGRVRTVEDDGGVMILRTPRSPQLDPEGIIVCDWRRGDVW